MARSLRAHVLGLALFVPVAMHPAFSHADTLPASVRACAAETDSLKRLVCYDREVARYMEPKPTSQAAPKRGAAAASTAVGSTSAAASTAPADAAAIAPSAPEAPAAPTGLAGTTASTAALPTAPATSGTSKSGSAAPNRSHISAHVVSIDRAPNEMVLHLDNGQSWEQLQATSGDLSLQVGDTVKIDKHLGSWWLSGPHVSGMKVRQKT